MNIKLVVYGLKLIKNFLKNVFPLVDVELKIYLEMAKKIPDHMLARQAEASIKTKKFHCQGGGIYALYPGVSVREMVHFIASYQTISDYLDNLCDRAEVVDERAFRQLHTAMTDALMPTDIFNNYYQYYPYKDDGGYLNFLVKECKKYTANLPSYEVVREKILFLAGLYSDLQVYKHLSPDIRESKMQLWFNSYLNHFPGISGWEFSAAAGSTLGIFLLVAAAGSEYLSDKEVERIFSSYFPWVCGLHILLDYYIDLYEDNREGDLNFVNYYKDSGECEERLQFFLEKALESSRALKYPLFHRTVVEGLMALYLSDQKAGLYEHKEITTRLLDKSGSFTKLLHMICRGLRKKARL
jgi:tetraprenyl-beta-curcumene synthase